MTFEAKKTTSTVFSSNHELYNLIKSASNKEFESWEHKSSHIKAVAAEKACIVLKWYYDQIFTPYFLVYHKEFHERIKNAVNRLQISALVPEIFKFEKWVKYANEMTDDVIDSTQYYIEYINRAILANLQCKSLKLGRLIVL